MPRKKKKLKAPGTEAGSLIHTGESRLEAVKISVFSYDQNECAELTTNVVEEAVKFAAAREYAWLNIDGVHNIQLVNDICERYNVHSLAREDILNVNQRAKLDDYGSHLFVTLRCLEYQNALESIAGEQLSLILTSRFVLSFGERPGDPFDVIRDRLRNNKGLIRSQGVDYLAYTLIDIVVDRYFFVLELLGDKIESIEEVVLRGIEGQEGIIKRIYDIKRETIMARKVVWPLREMLAHLERSGSPLITPQVKIFLRDVYDHTIHLLDTVEGYRDMSTGILEIYLASVSYKLNDVLRVLTVISTIFIPLTFIVGVYGMNFEYMPELTWRWGYFGIWFIMIGIAVGMLCYFKRRGWI
ncbi:MAG TPA: magnesium/cobalt transporter CorA [Oligoflexia bacterium]|nr:magnesium/cobalt transporter CorA [Oligoflexia bacterium]HMP27375.1 magnesium/cobalt transporter CorA [Oligoflexia bacterium]